MMRVVMLMLLVAACGSSAGRSDSGPVDAPSGCCDQDHPVDAPPGAIDAPPITIDAPPMSPIDATPNSCGKTGAMCSSAAECGAGFQCYMGAGGGVCAPDRPTCGGFVGALCTMAAPQCHYLAGSDFGPCLTVAEEMCVCTLAHDTVQGCPP